VSTPVKERSMGKFVQIIEYRSSRPEEIAALGEEFRQQRMASVEGTPPVRLTVTADRDRPGTYLSIVEFESYEAAMENSQRPETSDFAARMAELCEGPPTFYNLDVVQSWQPGQ
jgi:quinol monooxygenase YgiN